MSGLFIDVEVTPSAAADPGIAARLAEVCPVDIYAQGEDGKLRIVEDNLDECVLCRLCLEAAPGAVTVRKLYDGSILAAPVRSTNARASRGGAGAGADRPRAGP